MQITDIMTIGVEVIQPEASVRIAAEKMRNFNVGFLPVCDREKLVGMLTDRDITVRTVAPGIDLNTPVRELMTSEVIFGYEDQTLDQARQLMQEHLIRRLPILDANKRFVGIVSLEDLVAVEQRLAGKVLEQVSELIQERKVTSGAFSTCDESGISRSVTPNAS